MRKIRDKTACFTGHRDIPPEKAKTTISRLKAAIVDLINQGYLYFGAGGALGFDTLAEKAVLELKQTYPHIKLILVLPCLSQAKNWSDANKAVYEDIKSKADKVVYTSQEYTKGCMHKRNRHLVDNSSVCICYLNKDSGGTAYTVDYALKHGLSVINIAYSNQEQIRKTTKEKCIGMLSKEKYTQSLLDLLTQQAGCEYMSDLFYMANEQRNRLSKAIKAIPTDAFSLREWNEALGYLAKLPPQASSQAARENLAAFCSAHRL